MTIYIPMVGDGFCGEGFRTKEAAQKYLDDQPDWVISDEGWILELSISE